MVVADILSSPPDCKTFAHLNSCNPLNHQPRTISNIQTFFPEPNPQIMHFLWRKFSSRRHAVERKDRADRPIDLQSGVETSGCYVCCASLAPERGSLWDGRRRSERVPYKAIWKAAANKCLFCRLVKDAVIYFSEDLAAVTSIEFHPANSSGIYNLTVINGPTQIHHQMLEFYTHKGMLTFTKTVLPAKSPAIAVFDC